MYESCQVNRAITDQRNRDQRYSTMPWRSRKSVRTPPRLTAARFRHAPASDWRVRHTDDITAFWNCPALRDETSRVSV